MNEQTEVIEMVDGIEYTTDRKGNRVERQAVLDAAFEAGHILIENGAEIFRVEDTIRHISQYFGVGGDECFVISNGLFFSDKGSYAKIRQIPVHGARLDKVVAVNQLSREVDEGKYTIEEVAARLQEIKNLPEKKPIVQLLAAAFGSAGFCYMFGGSLKDAAAVFVVALALYAFVLFVSGKHMSKITGNILGGILISVGCVGLHSLGFGENFSVMIIGSIMPLIPGVAFVNGIRDIADGDYLSGTIRLLDAILTFLCIAIGVGVVLLLYQHAFGGELI